MIVHPALAKLRFEHGVAGLLKQPEVYARAGIHLVDYNFPMMTVEFDWRSVSRRIRLQVDATDYDYRPLSGWWVDAAGAPLVQGQGLVPSGGGFQVSPTPLEQQRCWFCFRGWREYHDHSSHQDVAWAAIRNRPEYGASSLVRQLESDLNSARVGKA